MRGRRRYNDHKREGPPETTVPDNNDAQRPGRILVVEDEILVRMFAVDALEDAGFKVEEAGTAADALAKVKELRGAVGAAVVDLGLPDRSGDELASELSALVPDLPILVASGRSERELRDRFAANPRVRLLVKPYTASMLLDSLAELGVRP
jgi:CheY-like chemotaxis protein